MQLRRSYREPVVPVIAPPKTLSFPQWLVNCIIFLFRWMDDLLILVWKSTNTLVQWPPPSQKSTWLHFGPSVMAPLSTQPHHLWQPGCDTRSRVQWRWGTCQGNSPGEWRDNNLIIRFFLQFQLPPRSLRFFLNFIKITHKFVSFFFAVVVIL